MARGNIRRLQRAAIPLFEPRTKSRSLLRAGGGGKTDVPRGEKGGQGGDIGDGKLTRNT